MRKNTLTRCSYTWGASWLMKTTSQERSCQHRLNLAFKISGCPTIFSQTVCVNDAKSLRYNETAGAWQFTSSELLPTLPLTTVWLYRSFYANAKPAADPTVGTLSGKISIVNNDTMTAALMSWSQMSHQMSSNSFCTGLVRNRWPRWPVWHTANRQAMGPILSMWKRRTIKTQPVFAMSIFTMFRTMGNMRV